MMCPHLGYFGEQPTRAMCRSRINQENDNHKSIKNIVA